MRSRAASSVESETPTRRRPGAAPAAGGGVSAAVMPLNATGASANTNFRPPTVTMRGWSGARSAASRLAIKDSREVRRARAVCAREVDRFGVAGVDVAQHAHPGIGGEDALESALRLVGAVGDHHHAGVLRVADADAAAVVHR